MVRENPPKARPTTEYIAFFKPLTGSALASWTVQAAYLGADEDAASTSAIGSVTLDAAATSTTVGLPAGTPATAGQPVTLSATVGTAGGSTLGGGSTVTFWDNGQAVASAQLNDDGQASTTYTPAATGTHSIVATFAGVRLLQASSSDPATLVVGPATTTTSIELTGPNVLSVGVPVALTAGVAAGDSTPVAGTVSLWDNGKVVATAMLDATGRAAFAYVPAGAGVLYLLAAFGGSAEVAASLSPLGAVAIMPAATTTTLVASASSSKGTAATTTLMATVTSPGAVPAGVVEFHDGTHVLAQQALDGTGPATATIRISPKWGRRVTAVFAGSGDFAARRSARRAGADRHRTGSPPVRPS